MTELNTDDCGINQDDMNECIGDFKKLDIDEDGLLSKSELRDFCANDN